MTPDECFAVATSIVKEINAALTDQAAAQRITDILNSLSHRDTGRVLLVLATVVSKMNESDDLVTDPTPTKVTN